MYDFEKTEIGFATEKNKDLQIRRLEALLKSRLAPPQYVRMIYNFLIGSLWIRFAPIQAAIHDCVSTLIDHADAALQKEIVQRHASILKCTAWTS
jgi:hypothetical protein